MTEQRHNPSVRHDDARFRRAELLISGLLRGGVVTSLLVIVAGSVISFVRHPDYMSDPSALQRLTSPGAAFPHSLADVASGAAHLRGQAIVAIGLLVLIATPVLRVAVSLRSSCSRATGRSHLSPASSCLCCCSHSFWARQRAS